MEQRTFNEIVQEVQDGISAVGQGNKMTYCRSRIRILKTKLDKAHNVRWIEQLHEPLVIELEYLESLLEDIPQQSMSNSVKERFKALEEHVEALEDGDWTTDFIKALKRTFEVTK